MKKRYKEMLYYRNTAGQSKLTAVIRTLVSSIVPFRSIKPSDSFFNKTSNIDDEGQYSIEQKVN